MQQDQSVLERLKVLSLSKSNFLEGPQGKILFQYRYQCVLYNQIYYHHPKGVVYSSYLKKRKKKENNNSQSNLKQLPNIAEDLTSIRDLEKLFEIKHSTGIYWYLYGKSYSVSLLHHFRIRRYSVQSYTINSSICLYLTTVIKWKSRQN